MNKSTYEDLMARRSIKGYKPDLVDVDILEKVVKAGQAAPSGMNKQPTAFLVVQDPELRNKLSELNAQIMKERVPSYDADPFYGAPAVIAVLANPESYTYLYDGSIAMENILLAAQALGLGSCWIHRGKEVFETQEGKEILRQMGIPETYEGIGFAVMGYSAKEPAPYTERKSIVRMAV